MGWFTKKPKVASTYGLYHPYLYDENPEFGLDVTQDVSDDASQRMMIEHVEQWCKAQHYIVNGISQVTSPKGAANIPTMLHNLDFRSLVYADNLDALLGTLRDTEIEYDMARILNLHVELISLGDPGYLTKFINKLYHALSLTSPKDADHTWSDIHKGFPYLWILYVIQIVLRKHAPVTQ